MLVVSILFVGEIEPTTSFTFLSKPIGQSYDSEVLWKEIELTTIILFFNFTTELFYNNIFCVCSKFIVNRDI